MVNPVSIKTMTLKSDFYLQDKNEQTVSIWLGSTSAGYSENI